MDFSLILSVLLSSFFPFDFLHLNLRKYPLQAPALVTQTQIKSHKWWFCSRCAWGRRSHTKPKEVTQTLLDSANFTRSAWSAPDTWHTNAWPNLAVSWFRLYFLYNTTDDQPHSIMKCTSFTCYARSVRPVGMATDNPRQPTAIAENIGIPIRKLACLSTCVV